MPGRVLMVSPHFPPDSSAGAHRVRLLAPHLPKYGWEPTIVSVDPRDYEGRLDPELAKLVPTDLRIVRCRAWPARWTRYLAVGDLGLRALKGLYDTCVGLLEREQFDVVFITIFPTYPALLGPILKRRFGVPFVLDYMDPWLGAWGKTVGGGPNGRPDLKSRLTRALARRLEPRVVSVASGLTAVSALTCEQIRARYPALAGIPSMAIPLGGEPADFEHLRREPRPNTYFDAKNGAIHLCYVGTLLPLGFETLRAVLRATARLRQERPELYQRLRLHFFGTSNQRDPNVPPRVLPVARELGVDDCVTEIADRIDYLDALTVQLDTTAILLMGSTERHYTASKLYPALLARRPILAVYHDESSVVDILRRAVRPPTGRVITYTDTDRAGSRVETICTELLALARNPVYDAADVDEAVMHAFSAEVLAGRLAAIFERARSN